MSKRAERRSSWALSLIGVALALLIALLPLTEAATLNLTYDANGNLVTGDGKYRVYNNQNQLVTLYNGSNASGTLLQQYAYHPTEERILSKKTYAANGSLVEMVVYVSEEYVQIINATGTYNYTYIHANGQQAAQVLPDGLKQFLLGDIEGSATVTTNSTGGVVERTSYTPYGGVYTGGASTRFNYEARENDPTAGDTDFRFRKYRPDWGLFTQPDNIVQNIYDPQTLNRYAFERNNPLKNSDPTGHNPVLLFLSSLFNDFLEVAEPYVYQGILTLQIFVGEYGVPLFAAAVRGVVVRTYNNPFLSSNGISYQRNVPCITCLDPSGLNNFIGIRQGSERRYQFEISSSSSDNTNVVSRTNFETISSTGGVEKGGTSSWTGGTKKEGPSWTGGVIKGGSSWTGGVKKNGPSWTGGVIKGGSSWTGGTKKSGPSWTGGRKIH